MWQNTILIKLYLLPDNFDAYVFFEKEMGYNKRVEDKVYN